MTDYDPRRPSGSGPEPMDPNGGSPYQGPAGYPIAGTPYYPTEPPAQLAGQPYPGQPYPSQPYADHTTGLPYPGAPAYPRGQYGPTGYGPPGFSPYPSPGWGGPPRPGQVTGAAVLGYVEAGVLMISALFVFAGASIVNNAADSFSTGDGGITAQFVLAGMANLVSAGMFIAGGTMFTGANPSGRTLTMAAVAVTAVTALYWVIRFHDTGVVIWAIAFLTMPAIVASLSFGRSVNAWLQLARRG